MSHPVNIQPNTMTTISGPTIILKTDYLKTLPGIVRLLEVVLGIVCVGIIGYAQNTIANIIDDISAKLPKPSDIIQNNFNGRNEGYNINTGYNFGGTTSDSIAQHPILGIVTSSIVTRPCSMFFFLMTTTFLIASFILLVSRLASFSTSLIISKGVYLQDVLYHVIGFVLLLAASISVLIETTSNGSNQIVQLVFPSKNAVTAASVIGLVNASLYLLSAKLALKSYRAEGCGRAGFTA